MGIMLSTDQVWQEVERQLFAVLGVVSKRGEARTSGIVYVVRDRQIYILSGFDTWKVRHIQSNPSVSLTVTIAKRILFMPWIRIPPATISFQGEATVHAVAELPEEVVRALTRGLKLEGEAAARLASSASSLEASS